MNKILTLLFFIFSVLGFSQNVKLKKGEILIDGTHWLNYTECGTFDSTCSLINLNGEEIIFFKFVAIDGIEPSSPSNPKGTLSYVIVSFLGLDKKFEIQKTQKKIIQQLFTSKVISQDGTLNEEKVDLLIEKHGSEFSPRHKNYSN